MLIAWDLCVGQGLIVYCQNVDVLSQRKNVSAINQGFTVFRKDWAR